MGSTETVQALLSQLAGIEDDDALDTLFDTVDTWLCEGRVELASTLLEEADPRLLSRVVALGVLSVSTPVRKSPAYRFYFRRLDEFLGDDAAELLEPFKRV